MKYLTQQTNAVRWEIISNLHSVLLFSLNAVMMLVSCDVVYFGADVDPNFQTTSGFVLYF